MPGRRVNLIERSYKNWRRSLRNSLGKMEIPDQWDRSGLPAWTYFNKELFDLETEVLFRRHWQLACRSEEHTSELQSPMRISYAVFCLKKKNIITHLILPPSLHNSIPNI